MDSPDIQLINWNLKRIWVLRKIESVFSLVPIPNRVSFLLNITLFRDIFFKFLSQYETNNICRYQTLHLHHLWRFFGRTRIKTWNCSHSKVNCLNPFYDGMCGVWSWKMNFCQNIVSFNVFYSGFWLFSPTTEKIYPYKIFQLDLIYPPQIF